MRDLAVVALEEVLADDLPVRLDLGVPSGVVDEGVHVEPELRNLRGEGAERLRQRLGVGAGVRWRQCQAEPYFARILFARILPTSPR